MTGGTICVSSRRSTGDRSTVDRVRVALGGREERGGTEEFQKNVTIYGA